MKWIDMQSKGAVCQVKTQSIYSLTPPILTRPPHTNAQSSSKVRDRMAAVVTYPKIYGEIGHWLPFRAGQSAVCDHKLPYCEIKGSWLAKGTRGVNA